MSGMGAMVHGAMLSLVLMSTVDVMAPCSWLLISAHQCSRVAIGTHSANECSWWHGTILMSTHEYS